MPRLSLKAVEHRLLSGVATNKDDSSFLLGSNP